ncbi:MAG: RagB/SusD family nutrient uptake outer membrane protein [Dysgonamonadaceae bacterium]|jgi:hypothetical protein|nr:RagB/SusD family nutrient uptake outer membrane protein [Dysgonamonadaceae bacterium]
MKTKYIISAVLFSTVLLFASCEDYVLDRTPLTSENDETFWSSDAKLRLYVNGFLPRYFVGYNVTWGTEYAPHHSYNFNDDIVYNGTQTNFELSVPNDRGSSSTDLTYIPWLESYVGPNWCFSWIRRANIMLNRIETKMQGVLTEEQYNHWLGVGHFFRAMEYAGLVQVFGDVPYYDHEVNNADPSDLYKPRTPRNEVMDAVYDDLVFAMQNVKLDDGYLNVNRDVVAAFASRIALFEGTWQKYHLNNSERAKKFLQLTVESADRVRNRGTYDIVTDFRTLFNSSNLAGNKDVIMYRHYDMSQSIGHYVASYCNMTENRYPNPNLSLIKAFICNDGSDWQTSTDAANKDFSHDNLIKTRDPRYEASFYKKLTSRSMSSCLYTVKFISRSALTYLEDGSAIASEYTSNYNENDCPLMRYAEVLLNWIEAKAELATLGGSAVSQSDIDLSINKIRNRPLGDAATAAGVKKTAAMSLANLPNSPDRGDVPQLIWEIRRERRMEFFDEPARLLDLKRWKKLEYMDVDLNPDIMRGAWIDANSADLKTALLDDSKKGILAVTDANGTVTVYNGTNAAQMVGFYSPTNLQKRLPFLNVTGVNPYLAPVGRNQRIDYQTKGFNLAQTEGWPNDL